MLHKCDRRRFKAACNVTPSLAFVFFLKKTNTKLENKTITAKKKKTKKYNKVDKKNNFKHTVNDLKQVALRSKVFIPVYRCILYVALYNFFYYLLWMLNARVLSMVLFAAHRTVLKCCFLSCVCVLNFHNSKCFPVVLYYAAEVLSETRAKLHTSTCTYRINGQSLELIKNTKKTFKRYTVLVL